jgi:hypothetical protein
MIDTVLIVVICITIIVLFLFWYARYSTKSSFSIDQNKNDIPDSRNFNRLFIEPLKFFIKNNYPF